MSKMQGLSKRRLQTKACIAGAKTFLMLFNIIFWIIGLILIISGVWMRASITRVFEVSQFHFGLATLFILTGLLMIIVGTFACCCTAHEKPTLLLTLSIFFFVVFILVFSASISGYVYRDNLKEGLHKSLNQTILEYGSGTLLDTDWDRIQQNLQCCGVDGFRDWIYTEWANENRTFPLSCCRDPNVCDYVSSEQLYPNGCYQQILQILNNNLSGIGIGMLLVAFFQILGMGLSCCLALNINKALYEEMMD
ncbi:tetraspanin-6-like [Oppia nitens]|uniref:tetraspanin-6-like n=1 Tax=Oppia nitens TaxID=1686743 RepID=UPI0023DB1D74|nr:tetraspanin-6-like [Oppia nitens]